MSKYKLVNLFDKVFITISVFLLIYAWIIFFTHDLIITFFLSLIFSFAVVFLIFYFYGKKKIKVSNKKRYLLDIEKYFLSFRIASKSEQLSLLNSILKKEFPTRIIDGGIVYKKDDQLCKVIVATDIEKLDEFKLISLIQGCKNYDKIQIVCCDFSPTINTKILKQTSIDLVDKKSLYDNFFSLHSIYPNTEDLSTEKSKKTTKEILKNFLIPSRAKSFFFSGLILIFSSIILPYHFYYLIFGSVLLIFSILCKLLPHFRR